MSGKAVRNTKPIRDSKLLKLSVVIPSAGEGARMRSYGPRSLLDVGGQTLLQYQINTIREVFPNSTFIVVAGFEANKLMNKVPKGTICVENERYAETNVLRSIGLGIRASVHDSILVVYGDTVFNKAAIDFPTETSCVIYDKSSLPEDSEVGCTINENKLENIFYGLSNRWSSITYITGKELKLMKEIAFDKQKEKLYGWEAINQIIDHGGEFNAYAPKGAKVMDIDTSKDIEKIGSYIQ